MLFASIHDSIGACVPRRHSAAEGRPSTRWARAFFGVLVLLLTGLAPAVASARPGHWEVEASPVFFVDGTRDSTSLPPLGTISATCPGYAGAPIPPACPGVPRNTGNLRLDYGVTYRFNRRLDVAYTHDNFDFSIGRVLSIAPLSVISGSIDDRTDRIALDYAAGRGLALNAHWFSHQRTNIEATASPLLRAATGSNCFFNSVACPGGRSNPASINSDAYGLGAAYAFGPHARFQPPMFRVSADLEYYPRAASRGAATCVSGGGPGSNAPACNTNGIPGYVGSQTTVPYSLTLYPLATSKTKPGFVPFVAYQRASVLFRAENTPEAFNAIGWGFYKSLGHGLSLTYTNLKLNGCRCSDTVPPPDNIRFDVSLLKLTYRFGF